MDRFARKAEIRVEMIKPQRRIIQPGQHGEFSAHGIGAEGRYRQGPLRQRCSRQPILMRQGLRQAKATRIAKTFQLQQ